MFPSRPLLALCRTACYVGAFFINPVNDHDYFLTTLLCLLSLLYSTRLFIKSPHRLSLSHPSSFILLLSRPYAAARLSHVVRDAQAEEDDGVIDTPEDVQIIKVESRCLEKVVEFLKHYHEEPLVEIKTPLEDNTFEGNVKQEWYQNFLKGIDQPMLFDLVTAANFMAIRKFILFVCCSFATPFQ